MFSTFPKTKFKFWVLFILLSARASNLDQSRILSFGKELLEDKVLCFKLETFANDKFKFAQGIISVFDNKWGEKRKC